jgi:hypothetical protein
MIMSPGVAMRYFKSILLLGRMLHHLLNHISQHVRWAFLNTIRMSLESICGVSKNPSIVPRECPLCWYAGRLVLLASQT